ncbi:MAG: LysR family transcriptional regulator [Lachnospiraceae bacterium]
MLDFRMDTFLNLCGTMNYTKTAKKLCITQPAVTQHIHYLEHYYGCRLFEYKNKTLTLTPQGKILKKQAYLLDYHCRQIKERLRAPQIQTLHIGATKTIGEFVIAPVISRFLQDHPECRISLEVENTRILLNELDEGKLDFILVEGFFDKQEYGFRLIREEPYIGVCRAGHDCLKGQRNLEDLFSETILVREEGSGTRAVMEQVLSAYNYSVASFSGMVEISNFSVIKELIAAGQGISFLYEAAVKQELEEGRFGRIRIRKPCADGKQELEITREFHLVYRKESAFTDKWEAFYGYCR